MPLVSVIVVNFNGCDLLKECLDSLREQTFRDFEVILVDNGSSDGSEDFVQEQYPEALLVPTGKNLGYGGGNNAGIRVSRGRYIILLNNDTKADSRWIEKLVDVAEQTPRAGMLASKILNFYKPELIDNTGLLIYRDGIARGRGRLEKDAGQYNLLEEVFIPSGCAALYRREVFDEIGLFDEDFFLYLDDVDIGLRARLAGWDCLYVPEAVVYHKYSATTEPYSPLKAYLVERNRIWLVLKHFTPEMIFMSLFHTLIRYTMQVYGILRGTGASSRIVQSHSLSEGVKVLAKAYISAFLDFGTIMRKRRDSMRIRKAGREDIRHWFRQFGIRAAEVALKD